MKPICKSTNRETLECVGSAILSRYGLRCEIDYESPDSQMMILKVHTDSITVAFFSAAVAELTAFAEGAKYAAMSRTKDKGQ